MRLEVRISDNWNARAVGLLIPVPPNTAHQRLLCYEIPDGWSWQGVQALNNDQGALWITAVDCVESACRYTFCRDRYAPDTRAYSQRVNRFTRLPESLLPKVSEIAQAAMTDAEAVKLVVEYVQSRFRYDPTPSSGAFPDVACEVRTGNCLDINTVFLSMLRALGISASYDIGYFVEHGQRQVEGWHCWVSVLAAGIHSDWDIPHHLKRGIAPISEDQNPIPGIRCCMSRGRGNRFRIGDVSVDVSHFCRPRWVMPDGSSVEAEMSATLTSDGEGRDDEHTIDDRGRFAALGVPAGAWLARGLSRSARRQ